MISRDRMEVSENKRVVLQLNKENGKQHLITENVIFLLELNENPLFIVELKNLVLRYAPKIEEWSSKVQLRSVIYCKTQ